MTLFKSQKKLEKWHSKKVSWVALLDTTIYSNLYENNTLKTSHF